jgi:Anti-sigma-K factor rskA/Putative zinc-finger
MVEGKGTPNNGLRFCTEMHEEFLELCALATSGSLSEIERKKLQEHLKNCSACREGMKQFATVVDHSIPALTRELAEPVHEDLSFSVDVAESAFLKRLFKEDKKPTRHPGDTEPRVAPLAVRPGRGFRRKFERYYFWLSFAAIVLLCASLGIVSYRSGIHRGVEVGKLEQVNSAMAPVDFQQRLETARRDRDAAIAQLSERNKAIAELKREIARQRNTDARLQASHTEELQSLQAKGNEQTKLALDRDRQAQQAEKQVLQAELDNLERKRSEDALRSASLEAKVAELSKSLEEQGRSKAEEDEFLAKDRDIRELMGARDLYVAEVYDVSRIGETEKAFGRVFYTKGKSLIFYAYDLNEEPGIKEASTFQAWGRRGPDWTQAFKLGAFYEDNVSKKRWVMKFNDKKMLDQIDAVFVTVEPLGGSERPTGKPLLFAYLKVAPNHP